MIKITYSSGRDRRECSLWVKGHAGYAEVGKDIVCASASILAYTVAQEIKDMEARGQLAEPAFVEIENGDMAISCRAVDDDTYGEMLHTFYIANVGYRLLAHNYPDHVEFITDHRRWKGE